MLGLGTTLCKPSALSGPSVFDKTFSFDSDIEGWLGFNMSVDFISSFTPSNATERRGILRAEDTTTFSSPYVYIDLSSFAGYDNSQPLYYSISYSVSSTTDIQSIKDVRWGSGGSNNSHFASATADEWSEASGALTTVGSNDFFFINFQTSPTSTTGEYVHIDSVRVSHEDFR
tara:strand:+ start:104 stop:622 length:519 start_codon:yes stop_codon:yes gene_type:complete